MSPGTTPRHVLITGAAGAIGGAIARAMRGMWPETRLALLDREASSMTALAETLGNASTHGADLARIDALPEVVNDIERAMPLDGLVNCAGVMRVRDVATWEWEEAQRLMAIDLIAPLRLQDLVVKSLVERGAVARGVIVNVASMAGRVPLRGCAYYGAAKAGLGMASEIARADLAAKGVRVVTVYPGPVRSALEQGAREDYGGAGFFGKFAPTGDPAELAEKVMKAIDANEARVIYPRMYQAAWSATNVATWFSLAYGPPPVG
jgi:short-subunit dehydrogenase